MISMTLMGGTILYPLFIYLSLQTFSPRVIAVCIGLVAVISMISKSKSTYNMRLLVPMIGVTLICLLSAISNQPDFMLYLPVLISLNLFITFGYSLLRPPSMIEMFARRMTSMALQTEQIRYCRQVTLAWVIFFVFIPCFSISWIIGSLCYEYIYSKNVYIYTYIYYHNTL